MAVFDFGWNLYLYIFSSFRRTRYIHWWMSPNLNSIGEWQIFCSSALPGHPAARGNTSSDNRARYFFSFLGRFIWTPNASSWGEGQTRYNDRNVKTVMSFRSIVIVILTQDYFCLLTFGGFFLRLWQPTKFHGLRLTGVLLDILSNNQRRNQLRSLHSSICRLEQ